MKSQLVCGHAKIRCDTELGTISVDYISQMGRIPTCPVMVVDVGNSTIYSRLPQGSKFIFGPHLRLLITDLQVLDFLRQNQNVHQVHSHFIPTLIRQAHIVSFVTRTSDQLTLVTTMLQLQTSVT